MHTKNGVDGPNFILMWYRKFHWKASAGLQGHLAVSRNLAIVHKWSDFGFFIQNEQSLKTGLSKWLPVDPCSHSRAVWGALGETACTEWGKVHADSTVCVKGQHTTSAGGRNPAGGYPRVQPCTRLST